VSSLIGPAGDEHAVQPRLVSISQTTELGTLYDRLELRAITDAAHESGLLVHMDGARLANAAAALGVGLAEASAGADVLSFGGTKNGLMLGEAVVFFDSGLAAGFEYLRKQTMQLASKMRFLAAQFDALLSDELWFRCARHANAMAAALARAVRDLPGLTITRPVEANAVFAVLPERAIRALIEEFPFYVWDEATGEVRWMCSWDTTVEDVSAFAEAIRAALT
jgi:threonine aldolase